MALNFQFTETKTVHPSMNFSAEFIAEFDQAWKFLKDNPSHSGTVIFETAEKRDKWFNMAKAYGAQHADKVFVSKVKGTGSDDKNSGKLVFKMEAGESRNKRIAEHQKRNAMFETLREHGIEFKRGVGSDVDSKYANLMKLSENERKALKDKAAKAATKTADKPSEAPKTMTVTQHREANAEEARQRKEASKTAK
jgi:hypothetical protein